MTGRLCRWIRYRRALTRAMDAIEDDGYRISPGRYEQLKAAARDAARRPGRS